MLNANDPNTLASLERLKNVIRENRPLVIWLGAGASRWANLPSWETLASNLRREFARQVASFPNDLARAQIETKQLPEAFELFNNFDRGLYNRLLVKNLSAPQELPLLYKQLISKLSTLTPLQVVTTNADRCLEANLQVPCLVERSDLEVCKDLIASGTSFIAKLHGSVSSIPSTVFTASDYREVKRSQSFLGAIRDIFSTASVLFLGYGLKDDYILGLLASLGSANPLFGTGPHFHVTADATAPVTDTHRIMYSLHLHPNHRAALTVLDVIAQANTLSKTSIQVLDTNLILKSPAKETAFFISDFRPSGRHRSSEEYDTANNTDGRDLKAITGLGFVNSEFESTQSVAFHDLVVGLICFDRVYLPLMSIGDFGSKAKSFFWPLVNSDAVNFIYQPHEPVYLYDLGSGRGDLGEIHHPGTHLGEYRPPLEVIYHHLKPEPGREAEVYGKFDNFGERIKTFDGFARYNICQIACDALLLPHVSTLLGFSEYVVPSNIPHWLAFPMLRLIHLIQTALICRDLDIDACRVSFGGSSLLSAAFSVSRGALSVYDYASFVVSGAYGVNVSGVIEAYPQLLMNILSFRESPEGQAIRREIADVLDSNSGAEFAVSVEGSLRRAIPTVVLQAARNRFSKIAHTSVFSSAPLLWTNSSANDSNLRKWRERSREILLSDAKLKGVSPNDPCLCGSGDKLRDCCLRPLR